MERKQLMKNTSIQKYELVNAMELSETEDDVLTN